MSKHMTSEIQELLSVIKESGLAEVSLEIEGIKLHVRRDAKVKIGAVPTVSAAPQVQPVAVPKEEAPSSTSSPPDASHTIKSPMIGTFYTSSKPDAPPFVEVGQRVEKGQTVCIIEAMKLFNEIEADQSGTITEVLVDNGTPVEFEQPLFRIQPS